MAVVEGRSESHSVLAWREKEMKPGMILQKGASSFICVLFGRGQ